MHIFIGDDMYVYENGEIFSLFYIETDDFVFPCTEWDDFINPVLCNWVDVLLEHQNSVSARYKFYYLTGSYRLDIYQDEEKNLKIDFVFNNKCYQSVQLSYQELSKTLYDALKEFRSILYKKYMDEIILFNKIINRISNCMQALKCVINE